ncbi:ABC transporter ATP-binding protein [Enterobacter roggenkampii]|uniref:ABC transporter ATP-binding protein n=1 Tax=Enterobacter roggenkampii TaxID=1812935 RepID=UPI002DB94C17|nr:ABC transporter ATP-binding protein [Enterobacter roggenkampii]MEB6618522.1 ABC transporter ATP-binding protein [Enterobacter roggenkampii]
MSFDNYAIKIDNISKCYQVYDNPLKRLKEFIIPTVTRRLGKVPRIYHDEFWALQDVSFILKKGETVGIVGKNGSGKSTLLQIIAGTLTQTSGEVYTNGRVAALLELGAGFNNDFTGRENIYLNATLLGLTRNEIDAKIEDILEFADIGHFIDSPVRSYSSGMLVRLAFAIQAQIEPEILIVDEALAVGDAKFQAKCFARLKQLKEKGTSILFVSHATEQIVTHCDSAILINDGMLILQDSPRVVVNRYLDLLFGKSETKKKRLEDTIDDTPDLTSDNVDYFDWGPEEQCFETRENFNPSEYRWGDRAAEISDFILLQGKEKYPSIIEANKDVTFCFRVKFNEKIFRPIIGFAVKTKEGVTIYNTNNEYQFIELKEYYDKNDYLEFDIRMPVILGSGDYFISIGIASCDSSGTIIPHDRRYDSIHLNVINREQFIGLANLNANITIK